MKVKMEITAWLRKEAELIHGFDRAVEAAEEIERLRDEVKKLREAMKFHGHVA